MKNHFDLHPAPTNYGYNQIHGAYPMIKQYRYSFFLTLCLAITGCAVSASHPKPPPANGGIYRQNNEGYSLLYKLMSDESRVGGIFIIKKTDESVSAPIKELSLACKAARKRLEDFRAADNRLDFDVPDLPYMEQRSRDFEASADRKVLLFSQSNLFELNLIFTQAQAMGYGTYLCEALVEKETDPRRKAFLQDLQQQCSAFHDRLMKLLSVHA